MVVVWRILAFVLTVELGLGFQVLPSVLLRTAATGRCSARPAFTKPTLRSGLLIDSQAGVRRPRPLVLEANIMGGGGGKSEDDDEMQLVFYRSNNGTRSSESQAGT